jgi:electron transport complex protein RnfD
MRTFAIAGAPHWAAPARVQRVMLDVLAALVPGVAVHAVLFGPGVLVQLGLATAFALAFEAAMLVARGRPVRPFLSDLSAPVTAWLFALSIPPLAPWWVSLVGVGAAIVVAKQLYGGLGHNLFNPAMVGYVVVLVAFPLEVTRWPAMHAAGFDASVAAIFGSGGVDAFAQATPLDAIRQLVDTGRTLAEARADPRLASGWTWLSLAYAAGGAYLLARRVIHWQVPTALLATVVVLTLPSWLADTDLEPSPLEHLAYGALVLGAFFIATDPVSAACPYDAIHVWRQDDDRAKVLADHNKQLWQIKTPQKAA